MSTSELAMRDPAVHGAGAPGQSDELPVAPAAPVRLSRRQVLHAVGVGGLVVAVAGTGALSYRVLDTGVLDPGSGVAYDPWQHWRDDPSPLGAVGAAVLAASPHNTQPWMFTVTDRRIDVSVDAARHLGSVDPLRREQHVGLGCALENLVLACQARGLAPTMELLPDGPGGDRVAAVVLGTATPQTSRLYEAIGSRHTDRGPYEARPVPAAVRDALVDAGGLSRVAVQWVGEAGPVAALSALLVEAAQAFRADRQQSSDAYAWFRADDDAVQRHRDGATLDAQGLSPLVLSLGKLLPASSRTAGDDFWVKQTRTVHTRTAAAYGVLTAADADDRASQLDAGRLLQRIHLTAVADGLALQHMNQITERIDAEARLDGAGSFRARFAELLPPGAQPIASFRIGYPTRAARPSPRRALVDVVR